MKKTAKKITARKIVELVTILCAAASFFVLTTVIVLSKEIPDNVSVVEGKQLTFSSTLPLKVSEKTADSIAAGSLKKTSRHYSDEVKVFGAVPVKSVNVSVVKETYVVPCGYTFGVKFYTSGVVVVGMTDVDTASGPQNPAYDAGIRVGDVIMAINGKPVSTNAEVAKLFSGSGGRLMDISLKRKNVGFSVSFNPVKSVSENTYKAGLWVRDSTAGIGTMTYYDPKSYVFGGLGHGICDVDTGEILPLMTGDVVKVNMTGIVKGSKGEPGELQGILDDNKWGTLSINSETGVYGVLNSAEVGKSIPVAMRQDVKVGPAEIIATVDNTGPKRYSVEIEKIHFNDDSPTKNMIIRVTDSELLKKTGGIVQGMSGCPIIQNGSLVGAVTHVFVNDPQRGYGIFAENMINTSKELENSSQKVVS